MSEKKHYYWCPRFADDFTDLVKFRENTCQPNDCRQCGLRGKE